MSDLTQSQIDAHLLPVFEAIEACLRKGHCFEQRLEYKKAELRFSVCPSDVPHRYDLVVSHSGFPDNQFDEVRALVGIAAGTDGSLLGDFPLDINHFTSFDSPVLVGWLAARNAPDKIKKGAKGITYWVDGLPFADPQEVIAAVQVSESQTSQATLADALFLAVFIGGSGYPIGENEVLGFGSDSAGIRLQLSSDNRVIHVPFDEIVDVMVDGGVFQRGGGFSGGGFGVVGFAVGAAASMALNKVSTRTEIRTFVRVVTNQGEINLFTDQVTPSDLEISLSEVRTGIRKSSSRQDPQAATLTANSLSDELLKIAELHKAGILTDAEFQAAKQRLIG